MFILPISIHGWRSKPATSEQYWPWDTSCRGGRQEKPPEVSGQGHELAPSVPSLHQGGTSQGMRQIGQRDKASCSRLRHTIDWSWRGRSPLHAARQGGAGGEQGDIWTALLGHMIFALGDSGFSSLVSLMKLLSGCFTFFWTQRGLGIVVKLWYLVSSI